jgi:glucose-6-phosphate isomerase, archaeal
LLVYTNNEHSGVIISFMNTAISASTGPALIDWASGLIGGPFVEEAVKTLGQLAGLFQDEAAWRSMDSSTEVYRVRLWRPVPDGTPGGLFWGSTILQPGRVGEEYFMTQGHFHAVPDRAEFYATVQGTGALLLMDESGRTWSQDMGPGTVHYVPGRIGHRLANTGNDPLVSLAIWPSDAGHDYGRIRTMGFGKRLVLRDGKPCLI